MSKTVKPVEPGDIFIFKSDHRFCHFLVLRQRGLPGEWDLLCLENGNREWDRSEMMLNRDSHWTRWE